MPGRSRSGLIFLGADICHSQKTENHQVVKPLSLRAKKML